MRTHRMNTLIRKNSLIALTTAVLILSTNLLSYAQNGNVMQFDGVNNYVDLGSAVANGTRTIEFWLRPLVDITPDLAEAKTLIARDATTSNIDEFNICFSPYTWSGFGGRLRFTCTYNANQSYSVYSDNDFWESNQWYHVAAVIHPSQGLLLFINGIKQSSLSPLFVTAIAPSTHITTIGCWGDSYNRFYNGWIDELRFSDIARYDADFTPPCPEFDLDNNTLGLYHFNEKNGTMVTDYSSYSYNGTNFGSTYLAEIICNTNSIAILTTGNEPAIFPNPTKYGFHIPRNFYNAGKINIEIFDTSMKTALRVTPLHSDFVDIHSLTSGCYVYVLTDQDNQILHKGTVIKQ